MRLYRQNCVQQGGIFVKDLTILKNRSLRDVVLVDNHVHSFCASQLSNGIPVSSYYNNKGDAELERLISYLEQISKLRDMRVANRKSFMLEQIYRTNLMELYEELSGSPLSRK